MIEYPSIINSSKAPRKKMVAFEKLDGSNIRVKYTPKRGFDLFGSRTTLIDETSEQLGGVVKIFNDTCKEPLEEYIQKYYPKEKEIVVFGEYIGPNSFAGRHIDAINDMRFVLFDILLVRNGNQSEFLKPSEFIKVADRLSNSVPTPKIVYEGNLTDDFIKRVREGQYEVTEGVICKGLESTGAFRGKMWMCKIKTDAYLQKLKAVYADNWMKYWE